jgi:NADPH-dependent 2,4-dienoyl-CoA reductase/sulfur reductase-like enzyme
VGETVRLSGWVHRKRDHGSLLFVDLRDHHGITQIVTDSADAAFAALEGVRVESVVTVTGKVIRRSAEAVNPNLPTGEIEVVAAEVKDKTRAGYFPGAGPIWVKLVCEPGTGRLLGGQIVGVEGAAKRIDVLATAIWARLAVDELALLDLSYAPPFSGVYDPLLIAAREVAKRV